MPRREFRSPTAPAPSEPASQSPRTSAYLADLIEVDHQRDVAEQWRRVLKFGLNGPAGAVTDHGHIGHQRKSDALDVEMLGQRRTDGPWRECPHVFNLHFARRLLHRMRHAHI